MSVEVAPNETSRVAVIAYHSSPLAEPGSGDAGGMTIYVRELARALARRGVHTDIFTRLVEGQERVTAVADRVRVVGVEAGLPGPLTKDALARHVGEFGAGVRAFATAQRAAYDLVHSHYWQSGVAALDIARYWNVPLVHSQHTLGLVKNSFLAPGDAPEPQSRIDGESEVITKADVLIASTDDEWRQLSCLYKAPHDRIKTIHPGVDHGLFHPGDRSGARAALDLDPAAAVMLYVGRIQPLKGLDLAVCAAAQLERDLDRPLTFLVVGGASGNNGHDEVGRVRTMVESLGLGGVVRFVGPRRHSDLPVFYRAADVLAVSSHSESFGLAALEAHACGTPVVGTAVGGLSHVVRNTESGFLIESRDPALFADRLSDLLSDDARWESFSRSSVESAGAFSWNAAADQMAVLYDCLIRDRAPELCTC